LVSPLFDVSPSEYKARPQSVAHWVSLSSSLPPYRWTNIVSVTATVDAAISADGSYVGKDRFQLATRYQAQRDAGRDEGAAVMQLISSNAAPEDVVNLLERDIQSGLSVKLTPTKDSLALYAMEYPLQRGSEARALLALYQQSGLEALKARASAMATYPRETIKRLPQN
jgi:hypothetical protein